MTKASKAIIAAAADVLNRHVADCTEFGTALAAGDMAAKYAVGAINDVLGEVAEGGRVICATELGGKLLGFIPADSIKLPPAPAPAPDHEERLYSMLASLRPEDVTPPLPGPDDNKA